MTVHRSYTGDSVCFYCLFSLCAIVLHCLPCIQTKTEDASLANKLAVWKLSSSTSRTLIADGTSAFAIVTSIQTVISTSAFSTKLNVTSHQHQLSSKYIQSIPFHYHAILLYIYSSRGHLTSLPVSPAPMSLNISSLK